MMISIIYNNAYKSNVSWLMLFHKWCNCGRVNANGTQHWWINFFLTYFCFFHKLFDFSKPCKPHLSSTCTRFGGAEVKHYKFYKTHLSILQFWHNFSPFEIAKEPSCIIILFFSLNLNVRGSNILVNQGLFWKIKHDYSGSIHFPLQRKMLKSIAFVSKSNKRNHLIGVNDRSKCKNHDL